MARYGRPSNPYDPKKAGRDEGRSGFRSYYRERSRRSPRRYER